MLLESSKKVRQVEAGRTIVRSGVESSTVQIVFDGLACRTKALESGAIQTLGFLVPGDLCNLQAALLGALDHSVKTLTACTVATVPVSLIEAWTSRADINRALWRATLIDVAISRQWILNLGARSAEQRIGHLFVELELRLEAIGLATGQGYMLPITQEQLGECAGLSPVHTNRVLGRLRDAGLVAFQRHRVDIIDFERLADFSGFSSDYLYLGI